MNWGDVASLRVALRALLIDFENPDLGKLGLAKVGMSYATWCFAITLGVYGFEAHGALGVGIVALVRILPGAIFSPFAGLLSDRFPRRNVMDVCALAMALILTATAIAAGAGAHLGVFFVLAALFAIASAGYLPAEAALMPSLAETPQELSAGNVTHSAMENLGFLVAAIVSGVLLAVASPSASFGVGAVIALVTTVVLVTVSRDKRPVFDPDEDVSGIFRETTVGLRTLFTHPGLRLLTIALTILVFFEGVADVTVVVLALELLHLEEGSVGFLNAAWAIGAMLGGAGLAVLLDRGRLVLGIAIGSLVVGLATLLPGAWPVPVAAYLGWLGVGLGYTFVEVAAKTLLQRLGSDETLGRTISALEAARLSAMALGSISAAVIISLLGVRGALLVLAALLPVFVLACWSKLRGFEVGAPVAEGPYRLLRGNSIFSPLPVATLERLSHALVPLTAIAGEDVIVQGDQGDRFYLIEEGQVEVFEDGNFRRNEGPGESFGEIALLRQVPRTATVRAAVDTRLLSLERDQFIGAITGHRRSHQVAGTVIDDRWPAPESP